MSQQEKYVSARHPIIRTVLNGGGKVENAQLFRLGLRPRVLSRVLNNSPEEDAIYEAFDPVTERSFLLPESFLRWVRIPESELPVLRKRAGNIVRRIQGAQQPALSSLATLQRRHVSSNDSSALEFSLD
ncbi:MAG TPA: hypothetical protein VLF20_03240 [Patescibacteria group bacterium]|nr:hypothetical protein [Patescibacteria group bacterium]